MKALGYYSSISPVEGETTSWWDHWHVGVGSFQSLLPTKRHCNMPPRNHSIAWASGDFILVKLDR